MNEELRKDIEAVLNIFVRPQLSNHGGDVEVVDLEENGTLWIKMLGQCAGCSSADETAKGLIQKELVSRIPQIKEVEIDSGIDADIIAEAMKLFTYRSNK